MRSGLRSLYPVLAAAALALVALGCTEEKIVEVERPPFNPPPDQTSGFLGYYDVATQQVTCGNCHVSRLGQWKGHRHAGAWATLQGSGHAQTTCEPCHTVSENGNITTAPAGYSAVQTEVYQDVQCESCHGPGITHVQTPDGGTGPLASIKGDTLGPASCGSCHSGTHHPFIEEWSRSRHSQMNSYPQSREDCVSCHTGQGALEAFGVRTAYLEDAAPVGQHEDITCVVCHDPHGSEFSSSLRFSIAEPSEELNLCIKCHHKRGQPDIQGGTSRGPHSPEGPLLLGEQAGWFPPNFNPELDRIRGSHGSTGNARLCATCHVDQYNVTDAATGSFVVTVTGHRFLAVPCVDANGAPLDAQTCSAPGTQASITERSWSGCTNSGCHADATAAVSALSLAQTRIGGLTQVMDSLLAAVDPFELSSSNPNFTVAKGSEFNNELAKFKGSVIHNPFLIEALLSASIQAMNDTYGPFPIIANLELQL